MANVPSIASRIVALDTRSAAPPPKTAEPIYMTREYAEWRRIVTSRAHGYCQDRACKYAMAEAVMQVTPCHPSNVKYRMIEALEGLDDAMDRLRVRRVG